MDGSRFQASLSQGVAGCEVKLLEGTVSKLLEQPTQLVLVAHQL